MNARLGIDTRNRIPLLKQKMGGAQFETRLQLSVKIRSKIWNQKSSIVFFKY